MEVLTEIVKKLKPGERRLIRNMLSISPNGEPQRRLNLFNFLVTNLNNSVSDKEACNFIYGELPSSKFTHLKRRLKNDILNTLLLQEANKRYKSTSPRALFECRRKILQGQLLLGRGAYISADKELNYALSLADQFEFYGEKLVIVDLLRRTKGYRKGIEEFEKINKGIVEAVDELKNNLIVKEYFNQLSLPSLFKTNNELNYSEFGKGKVKELQLIAENNNSPTFRFWFNLTAINYYNQVKKFKTALSHALELLELVTEYDILKSVTNIAGANMTLANIYLQLSENEQAFKHADLATQLFDDKMVNNLRALELVFFAQWRLNETSKAKEILTQAFAHKQFSSNKILQARWILFSSYLEYQLGNKETAMELSNSNKHISEDKTGWHLGDRILEMMILADDELWDILDYRTTSFYQHLQRHKENANIERAILIYKIFKDLVKTINYLETDVRMKPELEKLKKNRKDLRWNPTGFELIRFDIWFNRKVGAVKRIRTMNS